MSNIYIQEPPTSGKVLFKTTAGEIECELWSKEAPKTCRNFVQLVLDKFYDKTPFHRLVKGFIVQCGQNGEKADLIEPIKNEFHSRLRFMRRGLLGMATNEGSDNNMEFFFTLGATPELQNTHTIFGKVSGDTIYNLLKLGESEIDSNERPLHPHRINKIKILHNPFDDIEPRVENLAKKSSDESKKQRKEGVKNFKLISFGEEAEQDETEVESFSRDQQPKITQSTTVTETKTSSSSSRKKEKDRGEGKKTLDEPTKRKKSLSPESRTPPHKLAEKVHDTNDSDSDYEMSLEKEKMTQLERKKREIQDQIQSLKKEYHKERKDKDKEKLRDDENSSGSSAKDSANGNPAVKDYLVEKEKYKKCKINVKGASRENFTLQLLEKFKVKLHSTKVSSGSHHEDEESVEVSAGEEHENDDSWMNHKLDFSESKVAVLAKDASKKEDNWYDIYDPRNPLNKRKRGSEGGGGDEKSSSSKQRR